MTTPLVLVGDPLLTPEGSALSQHDSTTRGTLPWPRQTTAQRTAITGTNGLTVFDTDIQSLFVWQSGAWVQATASGGAGTFASLTLTGTGGAGYLSLPEQASKPSTPTNAVKLYADASNHFGWVGESGFGALFNSGGLSADRTFVLPNYDGTLATLAGVESLTNKKLGSLTTNGLVTTGSGDGSLSVVTTSAGLAALLSDETGSGALVFATSPALVTPTIASFINAGHTHANAAGGGQLTDAALSAAVGLAKGGTGVDLSGAGGATFFLAEDGSHVVSARAITAADLAILLSPPDIGTTTPAKGYFSDLREKIGGFYAIFTHANSADRTYTFPDYNGTIVTLAGTETLANKTLTTPTIGSFVNAGHNHSNAASGGQITDAALSAAVGLAKGGTAVDLSAAGGATSFLAQDGSHVISARAIASGDLTSALTTPPAIGGTTPAAGTFTTLASTVYPAAPTAHNLLVGNGTSALNTLAPGSSGNVAKSNGTDWTSAALTAKTVLYGNVGTTIGAGLTSYAQWGSGNAGATLNNAAIIIPFACALKNLNLRTVTTQDASGSLVFTLVVNGSPTTITITVSAGTTQNFFSDTTHTVNLSANDQIALQLVNNATAASASVRGFSIEMDYAVS